MADDDDDDGAAVAELGAQVLKVMDAQAMTVKLHNGKTVEGSFANFSVRRRERKGNVSLSGKLSVETDSGVLEMDCSNIASVKAK